MKKCNLEEKIYAIDKFSDRQKNNLFVFEMPEEDSQLGEKGFMTLIDFKKMVNGKKEYITFRRPLIFDK